MNIRTTALAMALGLTLASAAATAQVITYNPRTGDVGIDSQLGYMNNYGQYNRDPFINDVVNSYGAPRYLVNDLLTTRHWSPGDVYYACALAAQAHRPCSDAVKMYDEDHGQGWGAVAMRMGIKPGSAEFHALKGRVDRSNGRFKSKWKDGHDDGHGDRDHERDGHDNNDRGDGDHHGNEHKHSGHGHMGKHGTYGSAHGHGNGNSDGHGNGHGNGKGKGGKH